MTPDTLDAAAILACTKPEQLFRVGNHDAIRTLFRQLSLKWHPDKGGSHDVFAHITKLHGEALTKIADARWEGPGVVFLKLQTGKELALATRTSFRFELGQTLVGDTSVTFLVEPSYDPLFVRGAAHVRRWLKYSSDRMRKEVERYLFKGTFTGRLRDGRLVYQTAKAPDLIRLADVVAHTKGLDPKHTAWVVSSLLNLCCYLSFTGVVHHDLSPETCYISPRFHSVALLGGWWYATPVGERVSVVPRRTYALLPFRAANTKTAHPLTDLELVRATGRECLAGRWKSAPAPMRRWLEDVGSGAAVEQYRQWMAVLTEAFGPRRFVELKLNADAVYGRQEVVHG